jgi:two-component system response regulator QseB
MPVMDGKQFLIEMRKQWKTTPIIALTSDWLLEDKLIMFDLWADDYMTKPFEIEELIARIKSVLKRWEKKNYEKIIIWNIEINFSSNKIKLKSEEINFPHKQFLIIEYLIKNIWYPQNKVKIMEYVWWEAEENLEFNSTTLESHIYAIRKKLWKQFIKTVKGVWYIIEK